MCSKIDTSSSEACENGLTERDYKKGRFGFISNASVHSMGGIFISTTYFSAMLAYMNVSNSLIALNASLIYFAGMAMGIAPYCSFFYRRSKLFLWLAVAIQLLPLPFLFMFPMFGLGAESFPWLATIYLLSNILANIISPFYIELRQFFADHGGRIDSFYSWNGTAINGLNFLAYVIVTVLSAKYEKVDPTFFYFLLGMLALGAFVLRVILIIVFIPDPKLKPGPKPGNLVSGIWEMFCNRRFRPYLIYIIFFTVGPAFVSGVETVFFLETIGLSLGFISLLSVLALLGRMIVSPFLGVMSRKIGMRLSLSLSIFAVSASYLVNIVMTPENAVGIRLVSTILGIFSLAGTGIFAEPFLLQCLPEGKHISYMSFIQIVASGFSFLVGLGVSGIVEWTSGFSLVLFSFSFSNVHFLYLASTLVFLFPAIYLLLRKKARSESYEK